MNKENIIDFNEIKHHDEMTKRIIDKNELHGFFKGQTTPKPDRDRFRL